MVDDKQREFKAFQKICHSHFVPVGSVEEKFELQQLYNDLQQVEIDYLNFGLKHLDLTLACTEAGYCQRLDFNERFCLALSGPYLTSLRRGTNRYSGLRYIGFFVPCCFLSQVFRQKAIDMYGAAFPYAVAQMMSNQIKSLAPDNLLYSWYSAIGDGASLFIPESLAMMYICYTIQAYEKMRLDGADIENIKIQYNAAIDELYYSGMSMNLPKDIINRCVCKIVGDLIDKEPRYIRYFEETAYGLVHKGDLSVYTQKYTDAQGNLRAREYHIWDGNFEDVSGDSFKGALHLREPESVNTLRSFLKQEWDRLMDEAMTPEEWGDVVCNTRSQDLQRHYMRYIMEDNHCSLDDMKDLNALMSDDDDVSWMFDIDGSDPFVVSNYNDDIDTLLERGVDQNEESLLHVGTYPEFKAAAARWFNHHLDFSPMECQKVANQAYLDYKKSSSQDLSYLLIIKKQLAKRDVLKSRWDMVFVDMFQAVKDINHDNDERMEELQRLVGKSLDVKSACSLKR